MMNDACFNIYISLYWLFIILYWYSDITWYLNFQLYFQAFHKARLEEFNASFLERKLKGKAHVQGNHLPDEGAIEKHLVNSKDPHKTPIVTQRDLDDRIMVITFYQLPLPVVNLISCFFFSNLLFKTWILYEQLRKAVSIGSWMVLLEILK